MPFLDASALEHDPDGLAFLKAVIARAPCHASEAVAQRASTHTGSRAAGSVLLPSAIKRKDIQATMANGILKVTLPKPAHAGQEPKKIDIKAAA